MAIRHERGRSLLSNTHALTPLCLVIAGLVWCCACGGDRGTPVSPTPRADEPTPAPVPPAPIPQPAGVRTFQIGELITGTITSTDQECRFTTVEGGWGGLCNAFLITAPASGILNVTVRWPSDPLLALLLKTAAGAQIDLALSCCGRPIVARMPVEAGATYRIELTYDGRPAEYPQVAPVDYTVETSLTVDPEAQQTGAVSVIVFGDEGRTQRLSRARLEVIDGPKAGTLAQFNETSGFYVFSSLPAGQAAVRASADGFSSLTERVPVGTTVPRELVLQRSDPLPNATSSLSGFAFASSSSGGSTGAYVGVKIEILDGPLAGVFTFTSEAFGDYYFKDLPPGDVRVRASAEWLQSQTLSTVVSGRSRLDFVMQPR